MRIEISVKLRSNGYLNKRKTALEQHLERLSMEMRGIEPLSKRISSLTSTIIVILLELH